jgi:hypothetical protein
MDCFAVARKDDAEYRHNAIIVYNDDAEYRHNVIASDSKAIHSNNNNRKQHN